MSESVVIKLGGTTIAEQAQVLDEVATLARRRPVIVPMRKVEPASASA